MTYLDELKQRARTLKSVPPVTAQAQNNNGEVGGESSYLEELRTRARRMAATGAPVQTVDLEDIDITQQKSDTPALSASLPKTANGVTVLPGGDFEPYSPPKKDTSQLDKMVGLYNETFGKRSDSHVIQPPSIDEFMANAAYGLGNSQNNEQGYYSLPDLDAPMQSTVQKLQNQQQSIRLQNDQFSQNEQRVSQLGQELASINAELKDLEAQYSAAPSQQLADAINQKIEYHNELVTRYQKAYQVYTNSYAALQDASKSYEGTLKTYSAYAKSRQQAYTNWRNTIRDPNVVRSELEQAKKDLDASHQADVAAHIKHLESQNAASNEKKEWYDYVLEFLAAMGQGGDTTTMAVPAASFNAPASSTKGPGKSQETINLEKKISLLEEELSYSQFLPWYDITQNSDFSNYSKYISTANGKSPILHEHRTPGSWVVVRKYSETGYDDILHDYINRDPSAIRMVETEEGSDLLKAFDYGSRIYKEMSDFELGIYNYLYNKGEKEKAKQYLDYLAHTDNVVQASLEHRIYEREAKEARSRAQEKPVDAFFEASLYAPVKGISYIGQLGQLITTGEINPYSAINRPINISSAIRSEGASLAEKKWGKVGSFAYQTAGSFMDFLTTTVAGGGQEWLILPMMGSGAAADTVLEAKNRGLSDGEAFALGTVSGLVEVATEKIGIDAFLGKFGAGKGPGVQFLINATAGGTEEGVANLANLFADVAISQDKSQWQLAINRYMHEQGCTEEEAFARAFAEKAGEVGLDFLAGSLMTVPGQVMGKIAHKVFDPRTGKVSEASTGTDTDITVDSATPDQIDITPIKTTTSHAYEPLSGIDIMDATISHEPVGPAHTAQEAVDNAISLAKQQGKVSNAQATRILQTPGAPELLQKQTGMILPGTASGNRAAVKDAVMSLSAQTTETNPNPDAQPQAEMSPADKAALEMAKLFGVKDYPGVETEVETAPQTEISPDAGVKDQLRNSQETLNNLEPATTVTVPAEYHQMDKASKLRWIENKLRPTGFSVDRKGFGVIEFAMKRIKQAFRYFKPGSVEDAAFEAIPYVLEKGIEISSHDNHKGRDYGTVTFAAPVIINGERGNMAVVVKQTAGNNYKVHRILTPDGSEFSFQDIENKAEPTAAGESPETGSLATPKGSASGPIISDSAKNVNPNSSANADNSNYGAGTVGSAESRFDHKVKTSKQYSNTYANATDKSVRNAGALSKKLDPTIDQYDAVTEAESVHNAELRTATVEDRNAEYNYLMEKESFTAEDNDTAMKLVDALAKDGDHAAVIELERHRREAVTNAAQVVQSMAKYTRTPAQAISKGLEEIDSLKESDVPTHFWKKDGFDAWKKATSDAVIDMASKISQVKDGDIAAMKDIIRSLARFRNTTAWFGYSNRLTKAAEAGLANLDFETAKTVALTQVSQIPMDFQKRSKGQMLKTLRFQSMLASAKSVVRNLQGNGAMVIDAISDSTVGQFFDLLVSKATGVRSVGNDLRYTKEYFDAAKKACSFGSLCVELAIPTESDSKYTGENTRTFSSASSNPLVRYLSAVEKYFSYAYGITDTFFEAGATSAVDASLRKLGEASGLSDQQRQEVAELAGRRRTFKEDGALADTTKKVKEGINRLTEGISPDYGLGDHLLPFSRVNANMAQTGIDYTSLGVKGFGEICKYISDVKRGGKVDPVRQRKAVTDAARGVTGIGLVAMFTSFSLAGILKASDDDEWDKAAFEQTVGRVGAQLNLDAAVRFLKGESTEWKEGDNVLSLDFLEPFNTQMLLAALLAEDIKNGEGVKNYPTNAAKAVITSVLNNPSMELITDVYNLTRELGAAETPEEVGSIVGEMAGETAASLIPSFVRQIAQTIDPVRRDASSTDPTQAMVNNLLKNLPFASQSLPAKYGANGAPATIRESGWLNAINNFINPATVSTLGDQTITDYLDNLSDSTGSTAFYPEPKAPMKFTVNGNEVLVEGKEMREKYQSTYMEKIGSVYGALISNDAFNSLPDNMQVEILKDAKQYATEHAKASVSDFKMTSWVHFIC